MTFLANKAGEMTYSIKDPSSNDGNICQIVLHCREAIISAYRIWDESETYLSKRTKIEKKSSKGHKIDKEKEVEICI